MANEKEAGPKRLIDRGHLVASGHIVYTAGYCDPGSRGSDRNEWFATGGRACRQQTQYVRQAHQVHSSALLWSTLFPIVASCISDLFFCVTSLGSEDQRRGSNLTLHFGFTGPHRPYQSQNLNELNPKEY